MITNEKFNIESLINDVPNFNIKGEKYMSIET